MTENLWLTPDTNFEDICCDVETAGTDRHNESVLIGFAGKTPFGETSEISFHIDRFNGGKKSEELLASSILERTLFNPKFKGRFVFHNLTFDLNYIMQRFKPINRFKVLDTLCPNIWDTLALSRLLKSNKLGNHICPQKRSPHSEKYLAEEFLGKDQTSFEQATDDCDVRHANLKKFKLYNEEDCTTPLQLIKHFESLLEKYPGQLKYFLDIEMPHILNAFHLNYHGTPLNYEKANKLLDKIEKTLEVLQLEIFHAVGKMVNISSQEELQSALFFNPRLTWVNKLSGETELLRPIYITSSQDKSRLDLESLSELRKKILTLTYDGRVPKVIGIIIKALELLRARSSLELLINYAVKGVPGDLYGGGYRIYQNVSVSAASGRIIGKRPNLTALPKKIFKHTDPSLLTDEEKEWSVRTLIEAPKGLNISGEDINALDIVVVAEGAAKFNPKTPWVTYVGQHDGQVIDPHLAVLQDLYPERYINETMVGLPSGSTGLKDPVLSYWALKPGKNSIVFIHKDPDLKRERREEISLDNPKEFLERLDTLRKTYKQLNLATPYLLGAVNLALKLRSVDGKDWNFLEAQQLLDAFYEKYPEIRAFQDHVANAVYHRGSLQCMFGRVFYPQCWDDLNEYYQTTTQQTQSDHYEFIVFKNSQYWLLKFDGWIKDADEPVVQDMKVIDPKFGLRFRNLASATQLERRLFQKSGRKKPGKFQRKTEETPDEMTDLRFSRIQISTEIDKYLSLGESWTEEAKSLRADLIQDGEYLLPERNILFYRVKLRDPSSNYFRQYRPLVRAAKKFFPLYCQGVAATVAKICFTEVRRRLEKDSNSAIIIFYVHDQLEILHKLKEGPLMKEILDEAIRNPKPPFGLNFSGQFEDKGSNWK